MPDIELPEFLQRTQRLFGREPLLTLRGRRVAVAGCGGVGGAASLLLTRLGIERFHLADPGAFDPPDQNRQWGASAATLGCNKAEVHEELVRGIAPKAQVRTFAEGVTEANLDAFLEGCDLLIDSLDLAVPAVLRQRLYERAHALKMPAISAPILGVGTLLAVSVPPGPSLTALGQVLGATLALGRLPVVAPVGGHAVFIDAGAWLKPLPQGADAAASLCAAFFTVAGVRASPHLGTPQQQAAGVQWVRLALPVGIDLGPAVQRVGEAFARLATDRVNIHPLVPRRPSMPGRLGELTRPYARG